jgi:LysR family nitrogen assimilation transcriptional regulator
MDTRTVNRPQAALLHSDLSMRQIRYFAAIAQTGSFTAAALQLSVSQPALGAQIKQLEARLGIELFVRHARGIQLTEAGSVFLVHALTAIEAVGRAERAVAALRRTGQREVTVGLTPTAGRALIADLLRECSSGLPQAKLIFREGLTDELWHAVVRGDLDLAFCYDPPAHEAIEITPLYQEDLVLVGPPAVMGACSELVAVADLGAFPLVLGYRDHATRRFLEATARSAGVDLSGALEVEPVSLKREMLIRHGRCSIVPYGLFWDEIKTHQLRACHIRPAITRTVALLANTSLPRSVERQMSATIHAIVTQRIAENHLGWRAPRSAP